MEMGENNDFWDNFADSRRENTEHPKKRRSFCPSSR
jgi:hypothetical protein